MYQDELFEKIIQAEKIIGELREQLTSKSARQISTSFVPRHRAIEISANGKIAIGQNGLEIEYRGDDRCPYGRSATRNKQPFGAIIVHHTHHRHTTDWVVQYQIDGDPKRGGHFGYHFYIAPGGQIIQGAPLTKRTNHIKPSNHTKRHPFGRHANNSNAIGITCARAGKPSFQPTPAQIYSLNALAIALGEEYNIDAQNTYGHGEIQKDRHITEGTSAAQSMRDGATTSGPAATGAVEFSQNLIDDDLDDGPIYALEQSEKVDSFVTIDRVNPDAAQHYEPPEEDVLDFGAMAWWSSDEGPDMPLGARATSLNYTNQNATRNRKCTLNIELRLVRSVDAVFGPGCSINIYSGGQDRKGHGTRRTGSIRHDDYGQGGRAADVHVFDQNNRQIKGTDLAGLGQYWLASNFGGVGHEMRGGGIHLDEWTLPPPRGGMFWPYAYSQNLPWGAKALRILERGARGEFPGVRT